MCWVSLLAAHTVLNFSNDQARVQNSTGFVSSAPTPLDVLSPDMSSTVDRAGGVRARFGEGVVVVETAV